MARASFPARPSKVFAKTPTPAAAKIATNMMFMGRRLLNSGQTADPAWDRGARAVQDNAAKLGLLELLDSALDQGGWRDPSADHAQDPVGQVGQQDCIAVDQDCRQVEDHHVV